MPDEDNVREEYRPLTEREQEILELLLSVEVDGMDELRAQVSYARAARWNCGCASFNLGIDQTKAPRSAVSKSPLSETRSRNQDTADQFFELLLWVNDGWLSAVEIVDYVEKHGEQSPQEIPALDTWEPPILVGRH